MPNRVEAALSAIPRVNTCSVGVRLVFALLIARGYESGVPIGLETNHLWTFGDRQATSMRVYRDRAEALEGVGLME